jgi:hypothetical protein
VPRLLYASSMTVPGETEILPTPEGMPCQPVFTPSVDRYTHVTAGQVSRRNARFVRRDGAAAMYRMSGSLAEGADGCRLPHISDGVFLFSTT